MPGVLRAWQVPNGFTQQSLYDSIKSELVAAGMNLIDEYTHTSTSYQKVLVFKPFSVGIDDRLRVLVSVGTNSQVHIWCSDGFDETNNTFPGGKDRNFANVLSSGMTDTTTPVNFGFIKDADAFVLFGTKGTYKGMGGVLKWGDLPPFWDTALHLPWGSWSGSAVYLPTGNGRNPWNSSTGNIYYATLDTVPGILQPNPIDGRRTIVAGNIAIANSYAVWGNLSENLGYATGDSAQVFDTFLTDEGETWVNLDGVTSRCLVYRVG